MPYTTKQAVMEDMFEFRDVGAFDLDRILDVQASSMASFSDGATTTTEPVEDFDHRVVTSLLARYPPFASKADFLERLRQFMEFGEKFDTDFLRRFASSDTTTWADGDTTTGLVFA